MKLLGHTDFVPSVTYHPDGTRILSSSFDSIRVWDAHSGDQLLAIEDIWRLFGDSTYSPNGTEMCTTGWNSEGFVQFRDAESGELIMDELIGSHDDEPYVWSLAYSPDGTILASGSANIFGSSGTIALWNPVSGNRIDTLTGHEAGVGALAFRPDGRYLVSGAEDRTLKIWDVQNGGGGSDALYTLTGHTGIVRSVEFSPDGNMIVSGSDDRTVRIWDVSGILPAIDNSDEDWVVVPPVDDRETGNDNNGETGGSGTEDGETVDDDESGSDIDDDNGNNSTDNSSVVADPCDGTASNRTQSEGCTEEEGLEEDEDDSFVTLLVIWIVMFVTGPQPTDYCFGCGFGFDWEVHSNRKEI